MPSRRIGTIRITRTIKVRREVRVSTTVRAIPSPVQISQTPSHRLKYSNPLWSVRQAADAYGEQLGVSPDEKPADVFVCHAAEDKAGVAGPLARALRRHELEVWYDEFTLAIGDSIPGRIDEGLRLCRIGVVILSPAFFARSGWRRLEFDALVARHADGNLPVLPVWHEVGQDEVAAYSPILASKLARKTSELTIDEIAAEIAEVARK